MRAVRVICILSVLTLLAVSALMPVRAQEDVLPDAFEYSITRSGSDIVAVFSFTQALKSGTFIFALSYDPAVVELKSADTNREMSFCGKTLGEYSVTYSQITAGDELPAGELAVFVFSITDTDARRAVFGIHSVEPQIRVDSTVSVPLNDAVIRRYNTASGDVIEYEASPRGDRLAVKSCSTAARGMVTIPAYVNAIPVTSVADGAFANCGAVTRVKLPQTVGTIGSRAFEGCTGLLSVDLPGRAFTLGEYAFAGCTSLLSADLSGAADIPDYAFFGCTSLAQVTFSRGLERIGGYAFAQSGIKKALLPAALESIGESAFSGCRALSEVMLPGGLQQAGSGAFYGCVSLRQLVAPCAVQWGTDCFCDKTTVYTAQNSTAYTSAQAQGVPCEILPFEPASLCAVYDDEGLLFTYRTATADSADFGRDTGIYEFTALPAYGYTLYGTGAGVAVYSGSQLYRQYTLVVYNDLTGNAVTDIADVMLAQLALSGHAQLDTYAFLAADIDADGEITDSDFKKICKAAVSDAY